MTVHLQKFVKQLSYHNIPMLQPKRKNVSKKKKYFFYVFLPSISSNYLLQVLSLRVLLSFSTKIFF